MFELDGKLAFVTGSSRGIGRAIAVKLAEAGCDVIIHGRSISDALKETKEIIEKMGKKAYMVKADTRNIEQVKAMFDEIKEKFGYLDIMVNNAAVLTRKPFLELTCEDWDNLMETNVRGYFYCSQSAAKLMIDRKEGEKGGRIINVSSISQFVTAPNRVHYCASKAAIGLLTKGLALELAPYGITANEVLPGSIHTDFNDDVLSDPGFYKSIVDGIPLKRVGVPEDIAGAVVMLASKEASYLNGAEIVIDGGKTIY